MELGYLLLVAVSAVAGLIFRRRVSRRVGRVLLALGLGAAVLGVAILWLAVVGWAPFGTYESALVAAVLLGLAALALPFGLAVSWGRGPGGSDAA